MPIASTLTICAAVTRRSARRLNVFTMTGELVGGDWEVDCGGCRDSPRRAQEISCMTAQSRTDTDRSNRPTAANIQAIVELERHSHRERGWQERISDRITAVAGSLGFAIFHVLLFGAWAVWNAAAPARLRFDPYPYGLLTFVVSLEGVLIATFVLITQNRMSRQSDARDHLNLQIDLLAEQELTMLLRMVRRLSDHAGLPPDEGETRQAERFAEDTNVYDMMQTLQRELPSERGNEQQ